MTKQEWIDRFGEPKGWALASAILHQIEDYRRAAKIMAFGELPAIPAAALGFTADRDPDEIKLERWERLERRLQAPIVDLNLAHDQAKVIEEEGGWSNWLPALTD